jgi:rubrerythrin
LGQPEVTASAVIGLAEKLEASSSDFYRKLADISPENKDLFLTFAKDGQKNKVLIVRTYQETISDALEACFCFKGVVLKTHQTDMTFDEETSYSEALKKAIKLEDKAVRFYSEIAEASKNLLATVHRAFRKVAENRNDRRLKVESLLQNLK